MRNVVYPLQMYRIYSLFVLLLNVHENNVEQHYGECSLNSGECTTGIAFTQLSTMGPVAEIWLGCVRGRLFHKKKSFEHLGKDPV